MLFGDPKFFSVEAILEPGPEYSASLGKNVTGRFRLFFNGLEVGKFAEPCCVLRPLSEHLITRCSIANSLWHDSLEGKSPNEWFAVLNDALYLTEGLSFPKEYPLLDFLTNVSEGLNNVKGFAVAPPGKPLNVLLQLPESEVIHHHEIPLNIFCSVSAQFASWIHDQEQQLNGVSE